jgi:hypothetical protein
MHLNNNWKKRLLKELTRKQARASRLSDEPAKEVAEHGVAALIRLRDAR